MCRSKIRIGQNTDIMTFCSASKKENLTLNICALSFAPFAMDLKDAGDKLHKFYVFESGTHNHRRVSCTSFFVPS